jgi:hypothetical protein
LNDPPQAGAKLAWKLVTKTGTRTCLATSCGIVSALPNGADAFRGLAVRHKTPVEPEKQPPRTIEVLVRGVNRQFAISDPLVYAPGVSPSADPLYNPSARESPVIKSLLRGVRDLVLDVRAGAPAPRPPEADEDVRVYGVRSIQTAQSSRSVVVDGRAKQGEWGRR